MQAALFSSWTLFFGIFLFMAGNGLQSVLLGTRSEAIGFADIITGVIMSGYYIGFLFGSLMVPKMLATVGHVRVFGVLSALASSSILIHAVFEQSSIWVLMRIITGFAYSGMYISAESWINDKATNKTRGALLSIYMVVIMLGLMLGQLLIAFGNETSLTPFILVSVMTSLSVLPILTTVAPVPEFNTPERVSLRKVYDVSPLAVIGMGVNGVTSAIIFAMGAVYASKIGMSLQEVGVFMFVVIFGAMVLQYPIGRLSDRFDRRSVILGVQVLATLTAVFGFFGEWIYLSNGGGLGFYWLLVAAFLFGGAHIPLYSLYIAHANDFLTPRQIVATASMLVMINGIGAIFGPLIIGYAMNFFSPSAFFVTLAVIDMGMIGFVLWRMASRAALPNQAQAPFVAMPRSSSPVATTLLPDAEWTDDNESA